MVDAVMTVLSEAIRTLNFGIRGYYFVIAALCLLISPTICIVATVVATAELFYRQASDTNTAQFRNMLKPQRA